MLKNKNCPECKKLIDAKSVCCTCGWYEKCIQTTSPPDYRCEFQINGRRCRLNGTVCDHPYWKSPWYCSKHHRAINNLAACEAILDRVDEEYIETFIRHKIEKEAL